jgi:hypothetical protein
MRCEVCQKFFPWDSRELEDIVFEFDGICGDTGHPVKKETSCGDCTITI